MRANLRKFIMRDKFICGLDIGSHSIKASIIDPKLNQPPDLLGVYESPTHGFRRSSVSDLNELTESIHTTISELTKKTGLKLKEVQLGVGGQLVEHRRAQAVIPLLDRGNKVITFYDMKKVEIQARLLGAKMEEVILHVLPQCYKVDDVNIALNPIGLYGRKLELDTFLVIIPNTVLKNLIKAVNQAGYEVGNIFFTSYAASEVALTERKKREGCVLIDIGSEVTDILIFLDGQLKYFEKIPFSGDHVSRSLSNRLHLPFALAEELKESYANVSGPDQHNQEEILIKREDHYVPIRKDEISQAIQPEITQLVDSVKNSISKSNYFEHINKGMVMIGGGALLPGLPERIEQSVNIPIEVGKIQIPMKGLHNAAKFCSCVGLAYLGLATSKRSSSQNDGKYNWRSNLTNKMKELYQEYF